jgi:hypothetical protein
MTTGMISEDQCHLVLGSLSLSLWKRVDSRGPEKIFVV